MSSLSPDTSNHADDASGYLDPPAGISTGEFSEISVIHRSAHNLVLKAKRHGKWWALKCVCPGSDAAIFDAALRKEFEIGLLLPRDCAASVFHMEPVAGYGLCIVMDYVEGPTLREWLRAPHSSGEREQTALAIAEAVRKIHQAGVIHRDIKPSNIIVPDIGPRAVIIDFGLADTRQHSDFKQPAGTLSYMAPEQASQAPPDIRSDIYSLGAVFREMNLPFWWRAAIRKSLRPVASRIPDIDSMLRCIRRARNLSRLIPATLLAAAAVAAFLLIYPAPTPATVIAPDPAAALRADSLKRALDSLQAASSSEIAALSSGLRSMSDSVADAALAARQRKEMILSAIENEKAAIDRIWRDTGLRYLDTVDTSGFVATVYSTEPMDNELRRFISSGADRFSPEELATITDALQRHIRSNFDLWTKRRQQIRSAY